MTAGAGPSLAAALPQPAVAAEGRGPTGSLRMAGAIGRELAEPLGEMQAIVQDFIRTGRVSRSQVQQLNAAIDRARSVATRSQQLARLARGEAGLAPARLRLDVAVSRALTERMPTLQRLGITLEQAVHPVQVWLDAGLLANLVDAAIECGVLPRYHLAVMLDTCDEPPRARLRVHATPREQPLVPPSEEALDRLCWHLLREIAVVAGARAQYGLVRDALHLQLEFGAHTTLSDAADFEDTASAEDSWLHSESLGFGGFRILLVSHQPALRAQVAQICDTMGLSLSLAWAPSPAIAESEAAMARPDLVLLDARSEEPRTEHLHQQLKAADPAFPWLRIDAEPSGLSLENWMNAQEERLTLHNLRTQLPRVLLLNLSRKPGR